MKSFVCFGSKLKHLCSCSCLQLVCLGKSSHSLIEAFYWYLVFKVSPFWIQLCYFISLFFLGFGFLKVLKPRTDSFRPKSLDLFFMSVSATTVSSMSTVEMEVFSNTQLVIMTLLMFLGGEVFTSLLGIHFMKSKLKKQNSNIDNKVDSVGIVDQIEMGMIPSPNFGNVKNMNETDISRDYKKYNSITYLGYVVLGYLLVAIFGGTTMVILYLSLVRSAGDVLQNKGLKMATFSMFTVVSTFTNCGFVPTNENMIVFKNNPGLLILLAPQVLLGNTLYPSCLRFVIWVLGRLMKRDEIKYLLENTREFGYNHLFPSMHSLCLFFTVVGFILVQFVVFCCTEWNSGALDGMSSYQKLVGALFMAVNARHAGESIVDLSILSPAVLVLFVTMMYLPPYTSFLPINKNYDKESSRGSYKKGAKRKGRIVESLLFSQLSYLVVFIIFICITERKKIKNDPLNFTVLNIVIEVVSAYGNVGFTTGYSCKRRLKINGDCKDTGYGFSGRWSNEGKLVLMLVMFFGRLKKFNMEGGRAWKLL